MSELRAPTFLRAVQIVNSGRGGLLSKVLSARTPCLTISPAVSDLILGVRDHPDALEPFAPLPADHCWIEFVEGLHYARDLEDVAPFQAILIAPGVLLIAMQDRWIAFKREGTQIRYDPLASQWDFEARDGMERAVRRIFVTLCAVLATPGVRSADTLQTEESLRKSRHGYAPIVTYRCIDIDIDELSGVPEVASSAASRASGGVALHHVRGHLRLTEKGLRPVRPHWRGNAKNGIRFRDHNVMRNEEMQ